MRYQAVIFDLDGTLLDTLEDLAGAVNYALGARRFPLRSVDEVRQFVGNGVKLLIDRAVPPGTPEEVRGACLEDFRSYYQAHMRDKTAPYPGILPLLEALKAKHVATAVVSNKFDAAVKGLCREYFGDSVTAAVGENERAGVPKKPDAAMVRRALEQLGVPAERAVYVGDSDVDIQTARNAGMPCISVTWGFRDRGFLTAHGAVCFARSPEELLELVAGGEGN